MPTPTHSVRHILIGLLVVLLIAGSTQARPSGITGDEAEGGTDVAKTGCTCHSGNAIAPDDSVTVMIADVPYNFEAGQVYALKIEIIGLDFSNHEHVGAGRGDVHGMNGQQILSFDQLVPVVGNIEYLELHCRGVSMTGGCLLYTSPSPRDRG